MAQAKLYLRRLGGINGVNHFLNGGIVSGVDLTARPSSLYLHNKTLIFLAPNANTVTFNSGGAQVPLTIAQVLAQIEAQTTGVDAHVHEGHIALHETTVSGGVTISKDGTANALLGFGDQVNEVGVVYNAPSGTAPRFIQIVVETPGSYLVVVENA